MGRRIRVSNPRVDCLLDAPETDSDVVCAQPQLNHAGPPLLHGPDKPNTTDLTGFVAALVGFIRAWLDEAVVYAVSYLSGQQKTRSRNCK